MKPVPHKIRLRYRQVVQEFTPPRGDMTMMYFPSACRALFSFTEFPLTVGIKLQAAIGNVMDLWVGTNLTSHHIPAVNIRIPGRAA